MEIPSDLECKGCVIRLVRQATEWKDYQFMSCADVDIVSADVSSVKCFDFLRFGHTAFHIRSFVSGAQLLGFVRIH